MAYIPFQNDEENKANGTAAPEAAPTTGAGGGGAAPAGGASNTPAPKAASQGFANINQYLTANEGQGGQVAGTVASNLQNQYSTLQGEVNNAANQATDAINSGSTAFDQNLVNSAVASPSQFVNDPNNLAAWQKQYNATYTGPAAFEQAPGYAQAATAANKANQTYQLGQTGGGYTKLLNQIEKNPTAGRTALDKALIQSDPNAQNTIQGALSPFKGIQDYVSGKSAEIGKQATEANKTAAETQKKTKEAVSGAQQTLEQSLGQKLSKAQEDARAKNTQVQSLLATKPGTSEEEYLNSLTHPGQKSATEQAFLNLGLTPEQAEAFQGARGAVEESYSTPYFNNPAYGKDYKGSPFDLSKYAQTVNPEADYTRYNTADASDYANAQALAQLTGTQNNLLPEEYASQAGTAPKVGSFNFKQAAQDLSTPLKQQEEYLRLDPSRSSAADKEKQWQQILAGIQ